MDYLKKELNKLMPLALLYGAAGGVLLILISNLLTANVVSMAIAYALFVGGGVYLLNKKRYRKDTISSVLYGYLIFSIMTLISFIDTLMNANQAFYNPIFEQFWAFMVIFIGVLIVSISIAALFKRDILS
jgi:hypothetical protein